jgi:hypothetical protein
VVKIKDCCGTNPKVRSSSKLQAFVHGLAKSLSATITCSCSDVLALALAYSGPKSHVLGLERDTLCLHEFRGGLYGAISIP